MFKHFLGQKVEPPALNLEEFAEAAIEDLRATTDATQSRLRQRLETMLADASPKDQEQFRIFAEQILESDRTFSDQLVQEAEKLIRDIIDQ